ncbi:unnamed protein product [Rotaria sordida]|uniref:Uncharacterized protein n=1 Tax=Rotaria sordida TaxID=392033 RepID=A0A818VXB7_9BILA|nr:unnamed protein product [Rotaria sordida]CAF3716869.1 unnamed protein product [Rotaria sordida]
MFKLCFGALVIEDSNTICWIGDIGQVNDVIGEISRVLGPVGGISRASLIYTSSQSINCHSNDGLKL